MPTYQPFPPKKPRKSTKLPTRGQGGRFVKSGRAPAPSRPQEPVLIDMPEYSPHRVGIGEPIDWQREYSREVLPPRRRRKPEPARSADLLGWGVLAAGAVGIGYAFLRLPRIEEWRRKR